MDKTELFFGFVVSVCVAVVVYLLQRNGGYGIDRHI